MARLGKRASGSAGAWLVPPAGRRVQFGVQGLGCSRLLSATSFGTLLVLVAVLHKFRVWFCTNLGFKV